MKRDFFILAIDESKDYPSGFYNAVLTRMPAQKKEGPIKEGDYGLYQWYAGPNDFWSDIDPLPDDIVLIEKRPYQHNAREGTARFFIISDLFLKAICNLNHNFKEIKPVVSYDKNGNINKDRCLYVAVPRATKQSDCLDLVKSTIKISGDTLLERLCFRENWDCDLFNVLDIDSGQATLICSGKAKAAMEKSGIQGIRFIPAEKMHPESYVLKHEDKLFHSMKYEPI